MRRMFGCAAGLMLLISPHAHASDPVGIYAIVEKVEFEPDEKSPERVKVWGAFSFAIKGREYSDAARGYLYYSLPAEKKARETALKEWNDLKKVAGSGDFVAFASRYAPMGKLRAAKPPAAAAEDAAIKKWIAELDSDKAKTREEAEANLIRVAANAEKQLKAALDAKPSADVKARIEKLLGKLDGPPDVYPIGHGLYRDKANAAQFPPGGLAALPSPVLPAPNTAIEPGKVTLSVKSLKLEEPKNVKLVFEIQSGQQTEKSEEIAMTDKETSWTPAMKIQAGQAYTWRVWAVAKDWKGPVVTSEFSGKAAR